MGWLWASPSPEKPSSPAQGQSTSTSTSTPQTTAPNEPAADPEIEKFMDLFKGDASKTVSSTSSTSSSSSSSSPSSKSSSSPDAETKSWFSMKPAPSEPSPSAPPLKPLAESLLPTEMSCRQAFDQAWACNGLGGQWNAIYRYGEMRACSEQWDDFWFCMRTRGRTGPVKDEMVRAHYREKEWRKYGGGKPSSEDVWEARRERVPVGEAFSQELDENWTKN